MQRLFERAPLLLVLLAIWALANHSFVLLLEHTGLGRCEWGYALNLTCTFAKPNAWNHMGELLIAALAAAAILCIRLFARSMIAAPFMLLVLYLVLGCALVDAIFERPLLAADQIITDTLNVLSFVVALSLFFVAMVAPYNSALALRYVVACATSFAARDLSFLIFLAIKAAFPGTLALFLLFFLYSFGCFTIHLMSVASAIIAANRKQDAVRRQMR